MGLLNKNNISHIDASSSSKYILIPNDEFYEKMSSKIEYKDKKFNFCPYAFIWIVDENDLVDLEQKFYRYSYELFKVPPKLSDSEIKDLLKTICFQSHFTNNNFTKIEEGELFNLIKILKRK